MRFYHLACLLTLMACESGTSFRSVPSRDGVQYCQPVVRADFLYGDATRISYDYEPTPLAELVQNAQLVVRARTLSVRTGELPGTYDGASPTLSTLFELEIDEVYRGELKPNTRIFLESARSGNLIPEHIEKLNKSVPETELTLLLVEQTADQRAPNTPSGVRSFQLTSPQGLIAAAPCGATQPFAAQELSEQMISTDEELDDAIQEAVGS